MAKKRETKATTASKSRRSRSAAGDPLHALEPFDPQEARPVPAAAGDSEPQTSAPVSPLGPPQTLPLAIQAPQPEAQRQLEKRVIELEAAVAQAQQLIEELKQEREIRLKLEREMAALEVEVRQARQMTTALEEERAARLQAERRLATLEVRAEKAEELALQLTDERQARITLEREKATLDVQVQSMKKLDTLLTEERQARMNAQSRAATAEARLARLEGELGQQNSAGASSLFGRLRGRE